MILKDTLRNIVTSQRRDIDLSNTGIKREMLNEIDMQSPHVIILSGIRRCGKSTLLLQIMKSLDSYYFFNFEDPRAVSFELSDYQKLDDIFHEEFGESKYYFFDEIQNVPDWERAIRTLQDRGNKIFITGSNASLLSKELGSRLTGRHLMYELFPFSLNEMLELTGQSLSIESFQDYVQKGGFPEYLKYNNIDILRQLFRDIISRDIITRYKIKEHKLLMELAIFLLTNFGNEFSFNRLKNQFSLGSVNTIISYLSFLEDSYLLFTVPKFNFSYSKQRSGAKKVYGIDAGLIRANSASFTQDKGRLLENIFFLILKRTHREIFYYRNNFECDFLIKDGNSITQAFQVCHTLTDENIEREKTGLTNVMEITGALNGAIITYDQEDTVDGFPVTPIWKFSLEQ